MTAGWRSDSLRGEPDAAGPDALGAEGEGGGDLTAVGDATSGEDGGGRDRVDALGREDHGRDLAGVAAGLGAGGDDDVDAGLALLDGLLGGADEGGDGDVVLVGAVDDVLRGRAEGVDEELDVVLEGDVDVGLTAAWGPSRGGSPGGRRRGVWGRGASRGCAR